MKKRKSRPSGPSVTRPDPNGEPGIELHVVELVIDEASKQEGRPVVWVLSLLSPAGGDIISVHLQKESGMEKANFLAVILRESGGVVGPLHLVLAASVLEG